MPRGRSCQASDAVIALYSRPQGSHLPLVVIQASHWTALSPCPPVIKFRFCFRQQVVHGIGALTCMQSLSEVSAGRHLSTHARNALRTVVHCHKLHVPVTWHNCCFCQARMIGKQTQSQLCPLGLLSSCDPWVSNRSRNTLLAPSDSKQEHHAHE